MKKNSGMWIFLSTEAILFGTILIMYQIFYFKFHLEMKEASKLLHFYHGTINTVVLLTSSFFVYKSEHDKNQKWLTFAAILGVLFLGIKAMEYTELIKSGHFPLDFGDLTRPTKIFLSFYACMTFLHAIHVMIGIIAILYVKYREPELEENVGLYWHFVDIVWVFLYPLFYLAGRS